MQFIWVRLNSPGLARMSTYTPDATIRRERTYDCNAPYLLYRYYDDLGHANASIWSL